MQIADFRPSKSPSLDDQRDALQKGLGRAMQWATVGSLTEEPLLDACLNDKRFDMEFEENRGDWLWNIMNAVGAAGRFRASLLEALCIATAEDNAYQLCQLAMHYAQSGDKEFEVQLYDFVERKPIADCPWIGEGQLLTLGGENAFRRIARVRGELLLGRDWDWDDWALVDRAIEKLGNDRVVGILRDSTDPAIHRFGDTWQVQQQRRADKSAVQSHVDRMKAISPSEIFETVEGRDTCYWLRGWGMHAEEDDLALVLNQLWNAEEPRIIAKLLRAFSRRPLPTFDPRLIELCHHLDAEVQRSALQALKMNSDPQVREFAIKELGERALKRRVVGLFIKNFQVGDERRLLEHVELPDDACERHSLLMDVIEVLEENPSADCSKFGVIAYYKTPCELCRFRTLRLLHDRKSAPEWLMEECRYDASDECRDYVGKVSGEEPGRIADW